MPDTRWTKEKKLNFFQCVEMYIILSLVSTVIQYYSFFIELGKS